MTEKIDLAKQRLKLFFNRWRRSINVGLGFIVVHLNPSLMNQEIEKIVDGNSKSAVLRVHFKLYWCIGSKVHHKYVNTLFGIYHNVIDVHLDNCANKITKNGLYPTLVSGVSVLENKGL